MRGLRQLRPRTAVALAVVAAAAIVLPGAVRAVSASPPARQVAAGAVPATLTASLTATTTSTPAATTAATPAPVPGSGAAVFAANCSGCHGDHGQGLIGPSQQADAFPSLVAGMVRRGGISMPAFPQLSAAQVDAVATYVATQIADPAARLGTIAEGGAEFRLYCSGCHSSVGSGGALSQGRNAPRLRDFPAAEALAAMIYGRGNMPVFAGTTFDVRQQASVALYVETLESPPSPGGWGLGYIGPVPEGLAGFLALCVLLLVTVWLAWGKGQVKPDVEQGPRRPAPGWPAGMALLVAIAGGAAFVAFFVVGNNAQELAGTMALAFVGLGFALAYWGRDLTPDDVAVGSYPLPPQSAAPAGPAPDGPAALGDELESSAAVLTRRRFLTTVLIAAGAVVGLSQLALAASLGPKSRGLFSTAWRPGARLVTADGAPITRDALQGGGIIVAFPEGHLEAADSQVALLRLTGVTPQPGRESWSPEGFFAYSRVCTHAGCAVAQYEDEAERLLCPCHQSSFDLLDVARPVGGPAARPLPQLPLAIDASGHLIAQGDFTAPIGPGFWNLYA